MKIHPTIAQKHFLGAQADLVIGGGGSGAGKTTALLFGALRAAQGQPRSQIALMRAQVHEIILRGGIVDLLLRDFGDEGPFLKHSRRWDIGNSEVYFLGMDEPYRWRGCKFDVIFVDELQDWGPADFIRACDILREGGRVYATCTASPGWLGTWLEAEGLITEKGYPRNEVGAMVCLGSGRMGEKVETLAFVPFTAEDNPHLSRDYEYILGGTPSGEKQLKGCWG